MGFWGFCIMQLMLCAHCVKVLFVGEVVFQVAYAATFRCNLFVALNLHKGFVLFQCYANMLHWSLGNE